VVGEASRTTDKSFRDPAAPFYFLAARLWVAIALYRLSAEVPSALSGLKEEISTLALEHNPPHVLIREYAKRTLQLLADSSSISLTSAEKKQLNTINAPKAGTVSRDPMRHHSFDHMSTKEHRFKFNSMDTTRHWYDKVLRIFPTVSPDKFLDMAEHWIIDKWGVKPEANWWDQEPRRTRYDERRFGLYSHSHGELPVLERYGTHFEFHAMFCVAGELLKTHLVGKPEYGEKRFESWLERFMPTAPPEWIADVRGPAPLERRFWREDSRTDNSWVRSVRPEEFKEEIGLADQRPGWVIVNGSYDIRWPKRLTNVWITSALVSRGTSEALLRAIATASSPNTFVMPSEEGHSEMDEPPYRLVGWLRNVHGDTRFDDNDPLRHDTRQMRYVPGTNATKLLGLRQLSESKEVWVAGDDRPAFAYDAWSDEPYEDEQYPRGLRTGGWRLWANAQELQSFLDRRKMDLICLVEIVRTLRNEYSRSHESDKRRVRLEKAFVLKAAGSVHDAKGRIGTWSKNRGVDGRRRQGGHSEPLDGPPHRRPHRKRGGGRRQQGKAKGAS
jgi:hypothetical protein